jgi:hypothetical protein
MVHCGQAGSSLQRVPAAAMQLAPVASMLESKPMALNRRRVEQLLAKTRNVYPYAARLERISREFLGYPYAANQLIGSADTPEVYTVSLEGFDCVTFLETVLALSRSASVDGFIDGLRKIRYADGRIEWRRRNHYMTAWIRNNSRVGLVRPIASRVKTVSKDRILNIVPGLPPIRMQFDCIPKSSVPRLVPDIRTGDLIFFASTRKHLDVFHCGMLVHHDGRLTLRHASRSRNGVVDQDLTEFLKDNRMAGVIVVRPAEERTA